ncbi:unnamed protein product [Meloidogyne enterolobii]|uniref:Uncharacterized protein n=1 Tax=Meloidogyne enterolobii TaxID=390850 RepID=A0ACB0XW28_MELEN
MPHLEKHSTNNLIDFKRLYSHGTPSPTFLFSPKGKVFNYSTGELFDKILTKKEKSKEMLKQILDYIFTIEDKKVEKLFKKLNKIRKNYNTVINWQHLRMEGVFRFFCFFFLLGIITPLLPL